LQPPKQSLSLIPLSFLPSPLIQVSPLFFAHPFLPPALLCPNMPSPTPTNPPTPTPLPSTPPPFPPSPLALIFFPPSVLHKKCYPPSLNFFVSDGSFPMCLNGQGANFFFPDSSSIWPSLAFNGFFSTSFAFVRSFSPYFNCPQTLSPSNPIVFVSQSPFFFTTLHPLPGRQIFLSFLFLHPAFPLPAGPFIPPTRPQWTTSSSLVPS